MAQQLNTSSSSSKAQLPSPKPQAVAAAVALVGSYMQQLMRAVVVLAGGVQQVLAAAGVLDPQCGLLGQGVVLGVVELEEWGWGLEVQG